MSKFIILAHTDGILHNVYWRDYTHGDIPYDAIEIESDGRYIGLVHAEKGLIPAMIYPHLHLVVYELFGKKIAKEHIKVSYATLFLIQLSTVSIKITRCQD